MNEALLGKMEENFIQAKKRARVSSHPKCLHIGIILIVYVIQKVVQKYCFFLKYANI